MFVAAIVLQLLIALSINARQHAQRVEIQMQRRELCIAEYQLRAKITEIEIYIHKYIYVPPSPICRR